MSAYVEPSASRTSTRTGAPRSEVISSMTAAKVTASSAPLESRGTPSTSTAITPSASMATWTTLQDDGDLHSPSTAPSRRTSVTTGAVPVRWLRASRSSPGGLPSPTCWVSSWSRMPSAVARTRSAVDWTTSTGVLPGTLAGPGRHVRDGVGGGVEPVRGADHERDRLGFDLGDPAVQGRVGSDLGRQGVLGRGVEQDVAEFVGERLDLGGVVHVHADRDLAGEEVGQAVGAADRRGRGDQAELEAGGGDLVGQPVPQPGRCLALEQCRAGEFGDRVAVGLGDVPDVGRLERRSCA